MCERGLAQVALAVLGIVINQFKQKHCQYKKGSIKAILDKMDVDIDYQYCKENMNLSNKFYLTKISYDEKIKITWLHESLIEQLTLMRQFAKVS